MALTRDANDDEDYAADRCEQGCRSGVMDRGRRVGPVGDVLVVHGRN